MASSARSSGGSRPRGSRSWPRELRTIDVATAKQHYGEHDGKPFFADLVAFITRSPALLLVVEGPEAFKVVRTLMGATNPREAAPGTIRGDLAIEMTENLVHGSDSPESAAREIALFFPELACPDRGVRSRDRRRRWASRWLESERERP